MYCLLALSVYPSASLAQRLDLDALYAQAAVEGEVSAYLQGPPQVYAGFVREFEAKYPKGKIVSTYPHDDDLTLYSNTLIVEKYGWGMIERLLEQDMKFVRSHVLVSQETEKGERPVTFDQISQFNKVKFVVPDDLPMPVYPITTGIFANAPHPNAAKLFIAFVLSKEQQHRLTAAGAISVRPDVEPPPGLKPLSNYRIADGYISFISDEMRTKELRQRFEGYIGPPQGAYISTSPNPSSK